jgi:hypothetical protein
MNIMEDMYGIKIKYANPQEYDELQRFMAYYIKRFQKS